MRGGLSADVLGVLTGRLNGPRDAPIAVAVSGGGDSLALLHLASAWTAEAGRSLLALTVDHGLNPASAEWCAVVAERAQRLGAAHRTLVWTGEKPSRGLPAAARAARHALLADAARAAGASVILMGHTADDLIEAEAMRAAGVAVPSPRAWSPSPVWPEGRGIFLLRPLLGLRRAALRAFLAERGETWIDDPANEDPRFARSRARRVTAGSDAAPALEPPPPCRALSAVRQGSAGEFTLPRRLAAADGRLLSALLLCAAGTATPPRRPRLAALQARLAAPGDVTATLAGARIEARGLALLVCREAGERARGRLRPIAVEGGAPCVFDGRFLIESPFPSELRPLAGLAASLPPAERQALKSVPAAARGALPALVSPSGDVTCPILAQSGPARARPLGLARLQAALGAVPDEAAIWRVAKTQPGA